MAQFLILCLILAYAFVVLGMAKETVHTVIEPNVASLANPPASSPSNSGAIRKHGKHKSIGESWSSPSEAPRPIDSTKEVTAFDQGSENGQGKENLLKNYHHHSNNKSTAGGGVILGGLATTFLVAVFCYIRATGRKTAEPSSPVSVIIDK